MVTVLSRLACGVQAVNLSHHKVGETSEPAVYRITDDLEFSVELYEWTGKEWIPYAADDVQVQFFMMSPYVLKALQHNGKVRGASPPSPWAHQGLLARCRAASGGYGSKGAQSPATRGRVAGLCRSQSYALSCSPFEMPRTWPQLHSV